MRTTRLRHLRRRPSNQRPLVAMRTGPLIEIFLRSAERILLARALSCHLAYPASEEPRDEIAMQACMALAFRLRSVRRDEQ
jgi:hypothetical protein